MSNPKPLYVLWSKAAAEKAGHNISVLQTKLIAEVTDIVDSARGWFLHALPGEGEAACFQCSGQELPGQWKVFVQTACYKPGGPLPDNHPDPRRRGMAVNFPEVIKDPDNDIFAAHKDLLSG